ncbi:MAG: hypothetical protein WKF77_12840 [Planctomycetaceae bacterium]
MTGTVSISRESVPFKALLTDVTEDPVLLGRPCVMSLVAAGSRPLQLKVIYDATQDIPVTEMLANFRDTNSIPLRAGKTEKACLQAVLNDVTWQSRLVIVENQIQGQLVLDSRLNHLEFSASEDVRPEIIEAANDVFASLQTLNATVEISGTLRQPDIEMHSDVGEQVASGVKAAFTHQLGVAKEKLMAEVTDFADEQFQTLKNRFAAEYGQLERDNKELIEKVSEVQTLVASLRSGRMDARSLAKQVSSSSLIKEKDREKFNDAMEKVDSAFSGRLPDDLQDRIPKLPGNLPLQPGLLPNPLGSQPFQTGSFRSLLPTRPKPPLTDLNSKP